MVPSDAASLGARVMDRDSKEFGGFGGQHFESGVGIKERRPRHNSHRAESPDESKILTEIREKVAHNHGIIVLLWQLIARQLATQEVTGKLSSVIEGRGIVGFVLAFFADSFFESLVKQMPIGCFGLQKLHDDSFLGREGQEEFIHQPLQLWRDNGVVFGVERMNVAMGGDTETPGVAILALAIGRSYSVLRVQVLE